MNRRERDITVLIYDWNLFWYLWQFEMFSIESLLHQALTVCIHPDGFRQVLLELHGTPFTVNKALKQYTSIKGIPVIFAYLSREPT